jgi:poly(A) polymerase
MALPADKQTALQVLKKLRSAGHQAYFAGGCVRDMLLHRPCADYDIASDATPAQVKKLFSHVLLVGAKFGVAMVILNKRKAEITTFRSDAAYSDHRRPDKVRFASPREDALRRDFTINGMFYDPVADEVIDFVEGRKDLSSGVLRTIGRPEERFGEDYLRMLRAVRFAVRLNFSIDAKTAAAVRELAPRIAEISGERIFDELSRMLSARTAGKSLALLRELGLAQAVVAELFSDETLWPAAVRRVEAVAGRENLLISLAAMLMDLPAENIPPMLRRWGASNELRDAIVWMAKHRDDWRSAAVMTLADFKRLLAVKHFGTLRLLWRVREDMETGRRTRALRIARRVRSIPAGKIAPPPLVTGADLKTLGLREGPRFGRLLRALYDAQLNEQVSSHAEAMKLARQWLEKPSL